MSRISVTCISLAIAFSTSGANAGGIVVHTPTPIVKIQAPQTKIASLPAGSGAGTVTITPYKTKVVDISSPTLYKLCVTGKHIK